MPRPGKTLPIAVAFAGIIYLAIGLLIIWAHCTGWSPGHATDFHPDRVPTYLPWLSPGLLLIIATCFVRRARWAVILASRIFELSLVCAVFLLAKTLLVFRADSTKAIVSAAVLLIWLSILCVGLVQLQRQRRWLRTAASPARAGFPISSQELEQK